MILIKDVYGEYYLYISKHKKGGRWVYLCTDLCGDVEYELKSSDVNIVLNASIANLSDLK